MKLRYDKVMKSVKYYVGAGCERPIQPAPRSVPAPRPPAPRSAPLHRFSPTPAHRSAPLRSAPLHPIFGSLRSVFRSAHAPLTCSGHYIKSYALQKMVRFFWPTLYSCGWRTGKCSVTLDSIFYALYILQLTINRWQVFIC